MIQSFHGILAPLIKKGGSPGDVQVAFGPPQSSRPGTGCTVNVHLAELRENRRLRSCSTRVDGNGQRQRDPAWIDCHYLISAYCADPTVPPEAPPASAELEGDLLFSIATAILAAEPLRSEQAQIGSALRVAQDEIGAFEIPLVLAPPEGFPKIPEFWGTFGQGKEWKPLLYLVASLPALRPRVAAGPPVTTRIANYIVMGGNLTDAFQSSGNSFLNGLFYAARGRVFISNPLRARLLAHAQKRPEYRQYIPLVTAHFMQPEHAEPHDDHFHVRIRCPKDQEGLCQEASR